MHFLTKGLISTILCFGTVNTANARDSSVAKVSAQVLAPNVLIVVKDIDVGNKHVQLISQYIGKGCLAKFYFKYTEGNEFKKSEEFGTCSDIVRTKAIGNKVLIAMPNGDGNKTATYIYENGTVNLISIQ